MHSTVYIRLYNVEPQSIQRYMIWKLYQRITVVISQSLLRALFRHDSVGQISEQVELDRLTRIVKGVRQFYGLHPNVVKDEYGDIHAYLRQHLCEQDRVFLVLSIPSLLGPEPPSSANSTPELGKNSHFRPINASPAIGPTNLVRIKTRNGFL